MYCTDMYFARTDRKTFFNRLLVIIFWLTGLLAGLYFTSSTTAYSTSLMRSVCQDRLSIVGLFLVLTFPLLISAVLLRFFKPVWILPLVISKAFTYSFCLNAIMLAFGDAGWLTRWLLLFSDSCIVVLLLWFWLRNSSGTSIDCKSDLVLCSILSALIIAVDYYIVSPFCVILY